MSSTCPPLLRLPFHHIDAFISPSARSPYSGNAAAVVLCGASFPPDVSMQAVAAEISLSETCFVAATADGATYDLRWFTPTREVTLCGHGTLAAAHALWSSGGAPPTHDLTFRTLSGDLRVRPRCPAPDADADTLATLTLPAHAPLSPLPPPTVLASLLSALGLSSTDVRGTAFDAATGKLIIEVPDVARILSLAPSSSALLAIGQALVTGVCVTCLGVAPAFSFHSRYFSPWNGLPYPGGEDPVNGSSHTILYPYWALKLGREGEEAEALVESRQGGRLLVNYSDAEKRFVDVAGSATTVCAGHVRIPRASENK